MSNQEQSQNDREYLGYKPIDYEVYTMTQKEKMGYIILAAIFMFSLAYIFYHSVILSLIFTPLALLYPKVKTKEIVWKRKNDLMLQFKDMIYSLSSSMSAGRSLEPSFKEVLRDLEIIYPNKGTHIINEVENIVKKLEINEKIADILFDFAKRSHSEDIINFVEVLKSCKNAGGDLVEVIRISTTVINDKIEIKNEIDTMIAQKKFEQKLMSMAPVGMILLLSATAGDYMEPIFTTWQGRVAMTIAMITIMISYFVSQKIMEIKV